MTIDNASFVNPSSKKAARRRSSCLITQPSYHSAKITVNHWQLRDLVQPSSAARNEILYTYDDTIRATDRSTDKVSTVCKLEFHPRCFKELDDNIVAGGVVSSINHNNSNINLNRSIDQSGSSSSWRGLLSFYNRETAQSLSLRLGSYINNSVSISKVSNSLYNSFVCNNDTYLYHTLISPSSIVVTNSLSLEYPLNHSALSDDGKNLVVVGDCSNIYLVHPDQRPSEGLRRDNIIETQCDSGFSTSFSTSGIQFATCFQDGTCLIYDLRNMSNGPLKKIYSTRKNASNGAFRCVKYSRGTDDLLIISEHVGRVHVVDSRDFSNHQVIMLPVNSQPNSHAQIERSNSFNGNSDSSSNLLTGNLFSPKIVEYNDVLSYEGNLLNSSYNSEASFTRTTNFNSRSLNNFNLLSALASNTFDEFEFGETSDPYNAIEEIEPDQTASFDSRTLHRDSETSYTGSEFDYSDNEISGIDWYEDRYGSHIVIGCDKGLVNWDVDSLSRRSFPSFKLA